MNANNYHKMNILLLFDNNLDINKEGLDKFLKENLNELGFAIYNHVFEIKTNLISKPETFKQVHSELPDLSKFDRVFCFTGKQYDDNYFFHEYGNLTIFSFAYWASLTNFPFENGVIYFITNYIALDLDSSDFRHRQTTGCIYDFLDDKRGIDDGMRQARFCSNCLERVSSTILDDKSKEIFKDLKVLMNLLSETSKWNQNILKKIDLPVKLIQKRKTKSEQGINIVIASPGDTESERKILLESLESKFRIDRHEDHCGFRIMVNGWEQLASQVGYPQDVINKRLIEESDFVVAIFKHKLGTPTKDVVTGKPRAESGTVEELLQALDGSKRNHPIGMAYFYSTAPIISLDSPDKEKIEKDWMRLKEFKKIIQEKMIYKPYTEPVELLGMVLKDLEQNIINYIEKKH